MAIKSFTDLIVWQKGHSFVLEIYKTTSQFPKDELYGLTSQIKRAVISITSNIAEGFVRHFKKEKVQFYYVSLGSATEVQNQLLIARDLHFIDTDQFNLLNGRVNEIARMTNSLIRSINYS
ncbi:hypothetical protein A2767_02985 [Candidatus Roizmanbacteria bacterium RIFCSPHIGHO2_01_FULL_35_10]|uniref:Four helix bundle protein n=1 Tax=Candidatus Roizmanbacteria bacterium RIFCSPLOWO2_01_FULL_35_13 TaxID=1802055 RepID=A0A1F7ICM2_9BACT|nr:MAG: hypothetical protein A2767_02985 [Candidatus Roizmanbacteria bacterium RIFCSPHIGHO2_01_FULL_35_10]OGK41101.1 MAG: hypothetical protein A3A74_02030 [Candidatus Roizmanbacteria bacterium RIFCSPLOWO2_01_FULL_35_13]